MSSRTAHELPSRSPLLRALARPRAIAIACIAVLAAVGWIYLGVLLAGESSQGFLDMLCQPMYGATAFSKGTVLLTFAMWCAMVLAMMVPTAGPMIVTYADLAETAALKDEPAGSALVLTAGYVAVWLGGAAIFTAVQLLLGVLHILGAGPTPSSLLLSGALFLVAGLYQFSALKHACLNKCQHPIPFFFANWTARPAGVFRLGLHEGVDCLGCCWAMMLLMFAFGVMNVIWMALLGAAMTIEKLDTSLRVNRALGVIFTLAGIGLLGLALMAVWPTLMR